METYTLFWLTGESEIVNGNTLHEAMNNAGYSIGAIRALDFYTEGDQRGNWEWDKGKRDWDKKGDCDEEIKRVERDMFRCYV